jgi:hypothetical protein
VWRRPGGTVNSEHVRDEKVRSVVLSKGKEVATRGNASRNISVEEANPIMPNQGTNKKPGLS